MNSRMEKYSSESIGERTSKNQDLYQSLNKSEISKLRTYSNVKVIEQGTKEIDLNKIKKYIDNIDDNKNYKRRSIIQETGLYEPKKEEVNIEKDYDINVVLEKARMNREVDYEKERNKKLRDTQFDILKDINLDYEEEPFIKEEFNTDEKTLIDLINTAINNKSKNDLLAELQSGDDKLESITKEIEKNDIKSIISNENESKDHQSELNVNKIGDDKINKIDNSFFTNSMSFDNQDFDVENKKEVKKISGLTKFTIFIIIISLIAIAIMTLNYFLKLGLF